MMRRCLEKQLSQLKPSSYVTRSTSLNYCTSCVPSCLFLTTTGILGPPYNVPKSLMSTSNRVTHPSHEQPLQFTRVALGSGVPPMLHQRPFWQLLMESSILCTSSYPPSCQLPRIATKTLPCLHGRIPCLWTHPIPQPQICRSLGTSWYTITFLTPFWLTAWISCLNCAY